MSSDWSCGTNTSLMRLQSHRRATSWRRCEVRRVGGVRSVPFWCEILLRLLLHVGLHSRIENNEKMSCNCAALRSAFDLLFSSFLPLRLVFDSCFRFVVLRRVSGAFAQPRLWTDCNYPKPFISDGSYRLMTFLFKRFQRLWLGSSKRFVSVNIMIQTWRRHLTVKYWSCCVVSAGLTDCSCTASQFSIYELFISVDSVSRWGGEVFVSTDVRAC